MKMDGGNPLRREVKWRLLFKFQLDDVKYYFPYTLLKTPSVFMDVEPDPHRLLELFLDETLGSRSGLKAIY